MQTRRVFLITTIAGAVCLSACGTNVKSFPSLPPSPEAQYTLDSGDRVQINVFGEDRITNEYLVNDRGNVSVPLIGDIPARGLTVAQLKSVVEEELRKGILLQPSVSVQIAEYRPFFILGEVARPGQFPYVEGMTVLSAVAIGGGFTFRANKSVFQVTRTVNGRSVSFQASGESKVQPGDVVNVLERIL